MCIGRLAWCFLCHIPMFNDFSVFYAEDVDNSLHFTVWFNFSNMQKHSISVAGYSANVHFFFGCIFKPNAGSVFQRLTAICKRWVMLDSLGM